MIDYKEYEVTLRLKCQQSPRKWLPDVVNEHLILDESLLNWDSEIIDTN